MTKPSHYPSGRHATTLGAANRANQSTDDERPFAEIRKNLQDALRMLSLHRWVFFIPLCIVTSGAFILSLYYPRTYTATTSFERQNDPILADLRMSQGAATFQLFRTTTSQDLTSIGCMSEVLDKIGLTEDFARNEDGTLTSESTRRRTRLAASLASKISISTRSPNEHVDRVKITYTGSDPTIGKKLLDELKATYIRRTMNWIQKHLEGLRDYYQTETDLALAALRRAERDQTSLRLAHPYINPQNPESITTKLSQLRMDQNEWKRRRREYTSNLEAQRQLLASVESQLAAGPVSVARKLDDGRQEYVSLDARRLIARIHELDTEVRMLRSTRGMTDAHPEIVAIVGEQKVRWRELNGLQERDREVGANRTMDAASVRVITTIDGSTNPLQIDRVRTLVQISAEEAKIAECDISLESMRQEIERLADAKSRIFELQEQYADVTGLVSKNRKKHNELAGILSKIEPAIRVNEQGKLLHWSTGLPASGSATPVNQKSRTVLLLSLLAGAAAGIISVVVAELLD
ncbi:MAG: hypothetical protein IIB57_04155, partial [Planctomycetes bacterium]|nr:hypothetical protein [Planctomycetota bacterium]